MSNEMKAVLMIAEHQAMRSIMLPAMSIERDEIRWNEIDAVILSGGQRTALSWAYAIWKGTQVDVTTGMRDPFEGFRLMERDLQLCVIGALATRI